MNLYCWQIKFSIIFHEHFKTLELFRICILLMLITIYINKQNSADIKQIT